MMIELAGVTFRDTGRGWVFADLIDWYTLTDSKSQDTPKPQSHGSFKPGRDWRSSAAISFTAAYIGDSVAECLAAAESFTAAGTGETATMQVTDDIRTTSREVSIRHVGVPDFFGYDHYEVRFAVDVLAWDPRRYSVGDAWLSTGPAQSGSGLVWPAVWPLVWPSSGSDGRLTLTNAGTGAYPPIYRLYGGFDSALITNVTTGQLIGFDHPVPDGSVVEINTRTRQARIDNQSDVSRFLTWRQWWDVPASSSIVIQFDATASVGTPHLEALPRSAWIA